jgi:hypothetical protein
MTIKKKIIYPVFLECVQFTKDSFWKIIFEDLAYGKTPSGIYISKDFLCCSYKDKEFSYKIERKNPQELYCDVYKLLHQKMGIFSQKEKIKKRLEFSKIQDNIQKERKEWNDIKKKNIKDLLIELYVIDMKLKYNLSQSQTQYLLSIIYIAMIFKVITNKDVCYSNGKITHIEGIEFENKKVILKRKIYTNDSNFSSVEVKKEKKDFSEGWEKFLSNLDKLKISDKK